MGKIFNISEAASLAMHSMVLIAKNNGQLNAKEIANITQSSRNHLAKILQLLVKKNFLQSTRGPKGGFQLKKEPDQITMLEIYELIEGELISSNCGIHESECPFPKCVLGGFNKKFTTEFKEYLTNNKLIDLL